MEQRGVQRMTTVTSNQAVRNAFQLLELLSGAPDGVRLARLVEISGQPKTTVLRLLTTLSDLDVVCHDEDRYHLNARWQRFVGDQFTAPILDRDGHHLAGLTLRTRAPVACEATADRLRRLVADLAVAVSRRIGVRNSA
jgi:DNA-binding IclR family transcriptional regulator